MTIKAIETSYKGYRFRSRLEARWAIFFDAMGFLWEYEKEGYSLPSGPYLPDFFVTVPTQRKGNNQCWVEVKGMTPTGAEKQLVSELAEATRLRTVILFGPIPSGWQDACRCNLFFSDMGWVDCCNIEEALPMITHDEGRFLAALVAARSARFEHGETPR